MRSPKAKKQRICGAKTNIKCGQNLQLPANLRVTYFGEPRIRGFTAMFCRRKSSKPYSRTSLQVYCCVYLLWYSQTLHSMWITSQQHRAQYIYICMLVARKSTYWQREERVESPIACIHWSNLIATEKFQIKSKLWLMSVLVIWCSVSTSVVTSGLI